MITLHNATTRAYIATLFPTECTVTEEAAGDYSLSMTHPVDDDDVWAMIQNDRIIRAPVPKHTIPGVTMPVVSYWRVTPAGGTPMWKRLPKRIPDPNTPPAAWNALLLYQAGMRVRIGSATTYTEYKCIRDNTGKIPTSNPAYWQFVKRYKSDGTVLRPGVVLVNLPYNQIVTKIKDYNTTYMRGKAYVNGQLYEGYVACADLAESSTNVEPDEGAVWQMTEDSYVYAAPNYNAPRLETIAEDAEYTLTAIHSSLWNYGSVTATGTDGYILRAVSEEIEPGADPVSPDDPTTEERVITEQDFRIYSVSLDMSGSVTVEARQISYDAESEVLTTCAVFEADPATAVDAVASSSLDMESDRVILTDMTAEDAEPVTGDWSFKNVISAILDPSDGIAFHLKAKVMRDNDDIYILKNAPVNPKYHITYGTNLLGVSWSEDYDGIVTRIIPKAKDARGNPYFLPEVQDSGLYVGYVDSEYISQYAFIRYEVLDVDAQYGQTVTKSDGTKVHWDDTTLPAEMERQAQERFDKDECDIPKTTVRIEFLKLGDTEEYKQYRGAEQLALYDWVRVYHPQIGMDFSLQVIGYTWDAIKERYESIDIGRPFAQAGSGRRIASWEIGRQAVGLASLTHELRNELGV